MLMMNLYGEINKKILCMMWFNGYQKYNYLDINKIFIINIQSGLDDGILRYDLFGWKLSLVDMGSGRCFQEG